MPAWAAQAVMQGSHLSFLQLFGIGTALAILIDATLVRGVPVPPSCASPDRSTGGPHPAPAHPRRPRPVRGAAGATPVPVAVPDWAAAE